MSFLLADTQPTGDRSAPQARLGARGGATPLLPARLVTSVAAGWHYEVTVPTGESFELQASTPGAEFGAVSLPEELRIPARGRNLFSKLWGRRADALAFNPATPAIRVVVRSFHDSALILDTKHRDRELSFVARGSGRRVNGSLGQDGANRFSIREFEQALAAMPDGESLWDCVATANPVSRVGFGAAKTNAVTPRKDYLYPWFWMTSESVAAKAKVYWTKDSHLAIKIVKKGL